MTTFRFIEPFSSLILGGFERMKFCEFNIEVVPKRNNRYILFGRSWECGKNNFKKLLMGVQGLVKNLRGKG